MRRWRGAAPSFPPAPRPPVERRLNFSPSLSSWRSAAAAARPDPPRRRRGGRPRPAACAAGSAGGGHSAAPLSLARCRRWHGAASPASASPSPASPSPSPSPSRYRGSRGEGFESRALAAPQPGELLGNGGMPPGELLPGHAWAAFIS